MNVNPDTPEMMIEKEAMPSYDYVSQHIALTDGITYHYIPPDRMPKMQYRPGKPFPKVIHQFWVGEKEPPWKHLKTCSELHPDWEYHLWTEDRLRNLQFDSKYQASGSFTMRVNKHHKIRHDAINETILVPLLPIVLPPCT